MQETTREALDALFTKQKAAFRANNNPSYEQRMEWLRALEKWMMDLRPEIQRAVAEDFSVHSPAITDIFETGGVLGRNRYIQAFLEEWMAPSPRPLPPEAHGSSTCEVILQPQGVMGNISPWNFPIECSLVMVNEMLAAGNRVIVKVSELAPATADLLQRTVGDYFDDDVLAIVAGGIEFSQYFSGLPWDHLTYTGNTSVGRLIMQEAAKNLTPVTLELGGKNPTIFLDDGIDEQHILEYLSFKFCKSGQICTSPDYALVPEGRLEEWIDIAKSVWQKAYPQFIGHPDVTGIINDRHYNRLLDWLEEARQSGAEVIALNDEEPDPQTRQMPMYLVVNPGEELAVMREEVFGPITPIKTYSSVEEAYDYIAGRERPLASYLVTAARNEADVESFKRSIISGGAGVNVFGFQAAWPGAPFGGTGGSGIGCHAGKEGFLNYCHAKTVFNCAQDNPVKVSVCVPYGEVTQAVADASFG
ncbi:MAG: aldehyde dehydrogenase family protein [Haliea sp.]|nr:aldehyde dehydrogenase family protein [Haliea sp.]